MPTGEVLTIDSNQNRICFLNEDISEKFTNTEKRLLNLFIQKYGKTVYYDEISEVIYHSDADVKFTLAGINKIVQRLRDKLVLLGLPRNIIVNVRSSGYELTK